MPDASVVIAYYRNQATLGEQLEALRGQVTERTFEVVIADNEGSTVLRTILDEFSGSLDVRVVDASDVSGQCHARNVGVRAASAPYIAMCDADDVVSERWLDALCETLDAGDVLATGPLRVDRINPPHVWQTYITAGSPEPEDSYRTPALLGPIMSMGYLPFAFGCNIGMRRGTYCELGGMDEQQLGGSEDIDLSWRAQEAGYPIVENQRAVVDYRLRAGVGEIFAQRRRYSRSQLRVWGISQDMGRPLRGMSIRWAVGAALRIPFKYMRVRRADERARYAFAFEAGSVIGNLQGQVAERVLNPRIITNRRP